MTMTQKKTYRHFFIFIGIIDTSLRGFHDFKKAP